MLLATPCSNAPGAQPPRARMRATPALLRSACCTSASSKMPVPSWRAHARARANRAGTATAGWAERGGAVRGPEVLRVHPGPCEGKAEFRALSPPSPLWGRGGGRAGNFRLRDRKQSGSRGCKRHVCSTNRRQDTSSGERAITHDNSETFTKFEIEGFGIQKFQLFGNGEARECGSEIRLAAPCRQDHVFRNPRHEATFRSDLSLGCPCSSDFSKSPAVKKPRTRNARCIAESTFRSGGQMCRRENAWLHTFRNSSFRVPRIRVPCRQFGKQRTSVAEEGLGVPRRHPSRRDIPSADRCSFESVKKTSVRNDSGGGAWSGDRVVQLVRNSEASA